MRYIVIYCLLTCFLLSEVTAQQKRVSDTTVSFRVSGLCEQCEQRIEEAASGRGVKSADWNVESKVMTIVYDPAHVSPLKIHQRISRAGHDTEMEKASETTYNSLPACCKYRDSSNVAHHDKHEEEPVSGEGETLKAVTVTSGSKATAYINYLEPVRTAIMTQKELFKAACCNLGESFETNPSVDVSYSDGVTGSKQLQLLGLAGSYTQLTVENLPGPRGLATPFGLNAIPGSWIESIQLIKGTGSVVNGFESIAGQINVELKKPMAMEKLLANVYINDYGKTDVNLNLSQKAGKRWSTSLMLHDAFFNNADVDFNRDGFRDIPTGNLISGMNRWNFVDNNGLVMQFGVKFMDDKKTGGETAYRSSSDKFTTNHYGLEINIRKTELFGKIGYVFPGKPYKSVGLQLSGFGHRQQSYFGFTTYQGSQQNMYANFVYQSILGNVRNKFRTGISYVNDQYDEQFNGDAYKRKEIVPGGFFEYTFSPSEKFDLVAGIRGDHNSLYGWFATPRLNARYEPVKGTVIRASAGRGQRTANIFAENNSLFASARIMNIMGSDSGKAYGLHPEISWNKGVTIDQRLHLFGRHATLSAEYFRNDFRDQVIVDLEDPRQVKIYNLQGRSYSNSLQAELSVEPIRKLNVRFAYRYFDVKTNYGGKLLRRSLTSQNRGFGNAAYELKSWKFDYTVNFNGRKRVPSTAANPEIYRISDHSPAYILMNAQVSKKFGKRNAVDVYAGAENLTNYFQKDVIVAAADPFSSYFDASLIWGPVSGRMFYAGIRFTMN